MELPEDTWVDQHRYDRVGEAYGTPSGTACAQLGSAHVLHRPSAVHEIVSLLVKSGTESDLVKLSSNRGGRAEGKASVVERSHRRVSPAPTPPRRMLMMAQSRLR